MIAAGTIVTVRIAWDSGAWDYEQVKTGRAMDEAAIIAAIRESGEARWRRVENAWGAYIEDDPDTIENAEGCEVVQ